MNWKQGYRINRITFTETSCEDVFNLCYEHWRWLSRKGGQGWISILSWKQKKDPFSNASVQVEDHFVALKGALILLLENICDPILNTYGLYEGYAWKNGEQGTGTLTGLMNFISKIRMLEANGYAVWKSHIYKKWESNEDRRTVELNSVDDKMSKVAQCEDPAIARAFTRMIDHQGMWTLWQWDTSVPKCSPTPNPRRPSMPKFV